MSTHTKREDCSDAQGAKEVPYRAFRAWVENVCIKGVRFDTFSLFWADAIYPNLHAAQLDTVTVTESPPFDQNRNPEKSPLEHHTDMLTIGIRVE